MTINRFFSFTSVAIIFLLFLTSCGGGGATHVADDHAINAVSIKNKHQFKALAEDRNQQPVTFKIIENVAIMQGIMDSTIPFLIKNLINYHPQVDTIIMKRVLGTIDFEATLEAGRLIRKACLTTVVPYLGKIASGGVHLFLGGCKRIVETGGKLGIHTWKHTIVDQHGVETQAWVANDFPKSDPVHRLYLDYQQEMGISDLLYWTMIDVPFENYRNLTTQEIEVFNIATHETENWGATYSLVMDNEAEINWGSARFYVANNVVTIHGKISSRTPQDFRNMLAEYPEVHTLKLGIVTGTISPKANAALEFGHVIRDYCLTTSVDENSYVIANAVHAYVAGCHREFSSNGRIGISSHQPINNEENYQASIFSYYQTMGIADSFYRYQLSIPETELIFLNRDNLIEYGIIYQ